PYTIYHIPYTIYHIPYTIYRTPYTIYHTPYTIHHTPYTIYHTTYNIRHFIIRHFTIHHTSIGPWIDTGFFYDFYVPPDHPQLSSEDLKKIKKEMDKIIRKNLPITR
ncbi:hypothetical protein EON63_14045, partial [archaeon]